mmetsp:Transcript_27615/g.74717  ORF Transcript_27615/g.74717 Transcript_27615/m.74717 type:complete len:517 (+) Transcript_27615:95-1645(+)|eukprot:CAMPEP_0202395366 /NCGR_PEP_ID=MMETSP1127-20130417/93928_1 /ASSEMBLY_ACC=CAM_ASM_000462 /TAXON_ID=3047 /ORGANISM="Dunaliella tertiolecta, Strain CCMP1320" /LENGTH=516 /DNA_ID=CAMNT_0048998053 /DNA_START=53 /DNA_END=1603 /DNA_ORIENTATION=+
MEIPLPVPVDSAGNSCIIKQTGAATQQSAGASPERGDDSATLYVGGLPPYTNVALLGSLFQQWLPKDIKIVKDKCYGFVTLSSSQAAQHAIQTLNGQMVSGGQTLRVNYALVPPSEERERGVAPNGEPLPIGAGGRGLQLQHQIFVGDLSANVDDFKLYNTFARYTSCVDARVMWDPYTRRSKGFGFVTFTKLEDAGRAIAELNGHLLGSRRLRCDWAQHKLDPMVEGMDEASVDRANPTSTNIYVGNISPSVDELTITALFQEFGKVVFVRVHRKGSYGFVGFQDHWSAVRAIVGMHGKIVHDRALKCSWGTMGSFATGGGVSSSSSSALISPEHSRASALSASLQSSGGSASQFLDQPDLGSRGQIISSAKGTPVQTFHHAATAVLPSNMLHLGNGTGGYGPMMVSQSMAPGLASSAAGNIYTMPQAYSGLMPAMAQQPQHPYLMPASMLPVAYKPGQNTVSVAKMVPSMPATTYTPVPGGPYPGWQANQGAAAGVFAGGDLLLPGNPGVQGIM